MIEGTLIFLGGFLGSAHCVGMCGGFAVLLASQRRGIGANLVRQAVYSLGRIGTYAFAGAVAGFLGWQILTAFRALNQSHAVLAVAAGSLLLGQGLIALGWFPAWRPWRMRPVCLQSGAWFQLFHSPQLRRVFVAGMLNGFLPCGLVYAYLALAGSAGTLWGGLSTMILFGLGTVPALVLVSCGGSLLGITLRRQLFRVAAIGVMLTGGLSIARGINEFRAGGTTEPSCPYCVDTVMTVEDPARPGIP